MKTHKTFTHIPQRSFDAFVGNQEATLDDLMAALAVDPLEAEDAFKLFGVKGIPHSLKDFADRGRVAYRFALETIAKWVSSRVDTAKSLEAIAKYDPRLAVWCACGIAREALQFLPVADPPTIAGPYTMTETAFHAFNAINATEEWVIGKVNSDAIEMAARNVRRVVDSNPGSISGTVASAALGAVTAVNHAADSLDSSTSAHDASFHREAAGWRASFAFVAAVDAAGERAASDVVDGGERQRSAAAARAVKAEGLRLRGVVAAACLSYPVLP